MLIGHEMVGSGAEKVLVLHGWVTDHTAFAPLMPYLDQATFTYAFMDYRGYGASCDRAGEHTMVEIGGDAPALADHLGRQRFHLIGHSMGGMAVQWLAAHAPQRIQSVVAINPVPASGIPLEGDFLTLFESATDNPPSRGTIVDITTGNRHSPSWIAYMTAQSVATTTRDAYADYLQAWTRSNFAAEVQGNPVPLKVLVGEHNPAISAALMQGTILQWFPNTELEVMPNAGHYPMLEVPVYLATSCKAFMRAHH
ncbi:MAG: alpha/beta hydrolase [Chloroflexota bacterium]|nr:alpha/beta hydrolase [Chloroflexota bacterium]